MTNNRFCLSLVSFCAHESSKWSLASLGEQTGHFLSTWSVKSKGLTKLGQREFSTGMEARQGRKDENEYC